MSVTIGEVYRRIDEFAPFALILLILLLCVELHQIHLLLESCYFFGCYSLNSPPYSKFLQSFSYGVNVIHVLLRKALGKTASVRNIVYKPFVFQEFECLPDRSAAYL